MRTARDVARADCGASNARLMASTRPPSATACQNRKQYRQADRQTQLSMPLWFRYYMQLGRGSEAQAQVVAFRTCARRVCSSRSTSAKPPAQTNDSLITRCREPVLANLSCSSRSHAENLEGDKKRAQSDYILRTAALFGLVWVRRLGEAGALAQGILVHCQRRGVLALLFVSFVNIRHQKAPDIEATA